MKKVHNEPIRVLQCVNDMHRAGLETMLMNYYKKIDRTKVQFDFLTHRPNPSDYDEEIKKMGGRVYYAPRLYPQNYLLYFTWMKNFFKEHPEYKIIHSHIDSMSYIPLLAAKKNNIPVRISHSHSTSIDKNFKYPLKMLFKSRLKNVYTNCLSCGKDAGEFLFNNANYTIIPNAVDASNFVYNKKYRNIMRKELNVEKKFVIGHVGRMTYPKNQKFLIDIFYNIQKSDKDSVLIIVGVGEKEKELKKYVNKKNLSDKVMFLGNRMDVNKIYNAFDVFVLPSLYEGVPLVGIEAQFSDLPCFFSDKVPKEVKFNKKTYFVGLDKSAEIWAKKIISIKGMDRNSNKKEIINSMYDINNAYKFLESYYLSLVSKL